MLRKASLFVLQGPDKGRSYPLIPGTLHAGRGQNTHVFLTDPQASRIHCRLEVDDRRVVVVDENSTGGTLVNGKRITRQALQPGDVVQIGNTSVCCGYNGTSTPPQLR